jgi:hypothetical protein
MTDKLTQYDLASKLEKSYTENVSLLTANALQERRIKELEAQVIGLNRLIKRYFCQPKKSKLLVKP